MSQRPDLAEITEPAELRVAVSTQVPLTRAPVPGELTAAVHRVAGLLREAGHAVRRGQPDYGLAPLNGVLPRWFAGPAERAEGLDHAALQRRTRVHVRIGGALRAAGLVRPGTAQRWTERASAFFTEHDVLLTPSLGNRPPRAHGWHRRGWLPNGLTAMRVAGFTGLWNLAGFPAISVPAGRTRAGLPIGVQLVAAPGGESTLLGLAATLERLQPWPRTP